MCVNYCFLSYSDLSDYTLLKYLNMTRVAVTVPREEILFGADVEVQLAASLPKV